MVIGILNGAFMWTSDLVRHIDIAEMNIDFAKVSSYAGLETTGKIRELIGLKTVIKDRHVIIVEDIIDTGVTMS